MLRIEQIVVRAGVQVPDVDGLRMAREQVVSTVSCQSSVQLGITDQHP